MSSVETTQNLDSKTSAFYLLMPERKWKSALVLIPPTPFFKKKKKKNFIFDST